MCQTNFCLIVDEVDDPVQLLKLNVGIGASKTVNHLLMQFRDQKKVRVSQLEKLAKQTKYMMEFAEQVTSCAAALDDRGMMGSALRFTSGVKLGKRLRFLNQLVMLMRRTKILDLQHLLRMLS